MKIIESFPHKVHEVENCWIELSDGCRLAARIWLPEGAETSPVPAIFEYIPYRKRDYTSMRDNQTHGYFAGHGYACLRVDFRGCGDSEGTHMEQFSKQEQDDAENSYGAVLQAGTGRRGGDPEMDCSATLV